MATLHSRYVNGALAWYDNHRMRIVDAIGTDVVKWQMKAEDFQDTAGTGTDPRGYVTTVVEAGTGTSEAEASDEAGVVVELVTAQNDNDGINLQLVGEAFEANGRDLYFGISLEGNDATQSDFFVGLAISNTDALGGITDGIYFEKLDGGTSVSAVTEKDSTETQTDSLGTLADDTAMDLEFYYDDSESTVYFFIDGAEVASHTANIPDDEELTPTIQYLAGAGGGADRVKIHWAKALSIG